MLILYLAFGFESGPINKYVPVVVVLLAVLPANHTIFPLLVNEISSVGTFVKVNGYCLPLMAVQ